jgi:hypothetical protein
MRRLDYLVMMTADDRQCYERLPLAKRARILEAWRYDLDEPLREAERRVNLLDSADRRDDEKTIRWRGGAHGLQ